MKQRKELSDSVSGPVKGIHKIHFESRCHDRYISKDKDGKQYCAMSDNLCQYYKKKGNHEYCMRYKS